MGNLFCILDVYSSVSATIAYSVNWFLFSVCLLDTFHILGHFVEYQQEEDLHKPSLEDPKTSCNLSPLGAFAASEEKVKV